jgi:surface antigen
MHAVLGLPTIALAIGLGAAAHPAAAQINPFRSALANRLTNDDFQMIDETANKLLDQDTVTAGAKEGWSNPKSKASGTVEVTRNFKHDSMGCRTLRYITVPGGAGGRSANRTTLNWCKTDSGWKIVSLP